MASIRDYHDHELIPDGSPGVNYAPVRDGKEIDRLRKVNACLSRQLAEDAQVTHHYSQLIKKLGQVREQHKRLENGLTTLRQQLKTMTDEVTALLYLDGKPESEEDDEDA